MFDIKKRFRKVITASTAAVDIVSTKINSGLRRAGNGTGKSKRTYVKPKRSRLAAWQQCINEEIESGTYRFHDIVRVETEADTGAFVRQGAGKLIQTEKGTVLECRYYGEEYVLIRSARSLERVLGGSSKENGDYVDLPAQSGCFRCYLSRKNLLTRLLYATEEIHRQALTGKKKFDTEEKKER